MDSPNATSSPEPAPLLTYEQVADVLGIDVATLRRWVWAGKLPVVKLSRRLHRFRPEDLAKFIDSKTGLHHVGSGRMNGPIGDRQQAAKQR